MRTVLTRAVRPHRALAALAVGALSFTLVAGCGTQEDDGSADPGTTGETSATTDPTEEPSMTPTSPDDSGATSLPDPTVALPTGEVPPAIAQREEVQAAVADLAERLGVEESAVTVAGFASVTWRDGSLGCPEPGMMYTQALVPGEQLVLESGGRLFAYHAATGKAFSFCANPQEPAPGSGATM